MVLFALLRIYADECNPGSKLETPTRFVELSKRW